MGLIEIDQELTRMVFRGYDGFSSDREEGSLELLLWIKTKTWVIWTSYRFEIFLGLAEEGILELLLWVKIKTFHPDDLGLCVAFFFFK